MSCVCKHYELENHKKQNLQIHTIVPIIQLFTVTWFPMYSHCHACHKYSGIEMQWKYTLQWFYCTFVSFFKFSHCHKYSRGVVYKLFNVLPLYFYITSAVLWLYFDSTLNVRWLYFYCTWLYFDCTLTVLWLCFDCNLTVLWLYFDCNLTVLWLYSGCTLAVLWLYFAFILVVLWLTLTVL